MTKKLIDWIEHLSKNSKDDSKSFVGTFSSIIGLGTNLLLFLAKLMIGIFSGSVSIKADAFNNLSDSASSLITLVGFQIAKKPADEEHPFGHERFEYISSLFVSLAVTFVGFQFLKSSIQKIINPESIVVTPIVLIVLILSILLKLWQSYYYKLAGKLINSTSLKASSQDSLNDVITTSTVLVSAFIQKISGWKIDGYIGLIIALYILVSGIKLISESVGMLMGKRPEQAEINGMKEELASYPDILGFHDLLVHDYGSQKQYATVHIEMDDRLSQEESHQIIDKIERKFKKKLDVNLVCHTDPVDVTDTEFTRVSGILKEIVKDFDEHLKIHDIRIKKNKEPNLLLFDMVVPKSCSLSDLQIKSTIQKEVLTRIGYYEVEIEFDHNYLLSDE